MFPLSCHLNRWSCTRTLSQKLPAMTRRLLWVSILKHIYTFCCNGNIRAWSRATAHTKALQNLDVARRPFHCPLKGRAALTDLIKTAVVLVKASRRATSVSIQSGTFRKTPPLLFSSVLFCFLVGFFVPRHRALNADLVSALTFRPRSRMTPGGSCVCPGNTKGKSSALQTYCHGTFLLRMPPLMPTYKKIIYIYIFLLSEVPGRLMEVSWLLLQLPPPLPSGKIKTTSTGLLCSNTSSIRRVSRFP